MFGQMLLALYIGGMVFSAFFFWIVVTAEDNRQMPKYEKFSIWLCFTVGWVMFLGLYAGYNSNYQSTIFERIETDYDEREEEKEYVSTFAFAECPSCGYMEKEWKKGE